MPAAFERLYELALLLRRHTPKDVIAVHRRIELGRRIEGRGVHVSVGARHAHHARDRRHRTRVVAADHVEGHALLVKVADGLGRRGTDLVTDGHKAHGLGLAHHIAVGRKAVHARHHEHTAGIGELGHTILDLHKCAIREHKLRGAHHIGALRKRRAAPLFGRRERNDRQRLGHLNRAIGVVVEQRLAGLVGICRGRTRHVGEREVEHRGLDGNSSLVRVRAKANTLNRQRVGALDLHTARGNGARLVQAQHVDARERLDAVELLCQHLATRQAHRGNREHRRSQQHQALRNHAQQGTHRGQQRRRRHTTRQQLGEAPGKRAIARGSRGIPQLAHTRGKERQTKRNHDNAREPHDGVQRVHDLGIDPFDVLGLVVDLCHVVIGADMDHAGAQQARIDKAAAHELGARLFLNEVALARQQALVDERLARHHHGVGRNLVTASQTNDVVEHDLVQVELHLGAVTHRDGLLRGEQRKLVDHPLGTHGLDDANSRVQEHHEQERQVLKRTGQQHQNRQDHVDQVKQRAEVLDDELFDRLGLELHVAVDLTGGDALLDLGGRESALDIRCCHTTSHHVASV